MNRAIFAGSLLSVIFLMVGTFVFPTNPVMWLASTSVAATVFRSIVAVLLLGVLFTAPPRKLAARVAMGSMGALLVLVGLALSLGNSMHLLDIVLCFQIGFGLGLEALELNEEELDEKVAELRRNHRAGTQSRRAKAAA